jgi:hypothetical protein
VLVDVCFSEPLDVVDRPCCFFGGSSESRRLDNRDDDDTLVVLSEALFDRLMTGGGDGDGERARLRY